MLLKPKGLSFIIPKEVEEKEQLWGTGTYKFPAKFFSKETVLNKVSDSFIRPTVSVCPGEMDLVSVFSCHQGDNSSSLESF